MTSEDFNLNCGVPQGSCMGPTLFTLYVSHLFNILSQHLPSIHGYADDTQIDLSFRPSSIHSDINAVKPSLEWKQNSFTGPLSYRAFREMCRWCQM